MLFEELKKLKQVVDYENSLVPPEIIKDSYQRCRDSRVRTDLTKIPRVLSNIQVEDLLTDSKLLISVARPVIRQEMHPYFTDENQLIILCDSEAYALDLMSSPEMLNMCYQKGFGQGSCFKEEVCGQCYSFGHTTEEHGGRKRGAAFQ
jgi:transcriptional regulator of acetoin/glycerol metabolism